MSNTFSVNVKASKINPKVLVFSLCGSLNAVTVTNLDTVLRRAFEEGHYKWILDLANLEYISSAGLGEFNVFLEPLRKKGGDMAILGMNKKVEKLFQVVGYFQIFHIYVNESDAVKAFQV